MNNSTQDYRERTIKLIASNKKAEHDYIILQTYEAGIVLLGTEVKSLRNGRCSLVDAYCTIKNNELYVINLHINEYEFGNRENHKPRRERKLLLHDYEINKIRTAISEKGLTVVPLEIYFSGHLVKLKIAIVKPKKKYDKRESTKEKEHIKEIARKFKFS